MVHMPLHDQSGGLDEALRQDLRKVAASSISHGLEHGSLLPVNPQEHAEPLRALRASFVTLQIGGVLRGCIGTLEAVRPLVSDVAYNAYAAAFRDPRFSPLRHDEFARLDIHISILSPAQPIEFQSEQDLLRQLRPGVDGLILEEGYHRGTFLPSVWESLPEAPEFLRHLKLKAGLPFDYWSDTLKVQRYTTESFG
jgi:AmmeMemoRadiSam system protein A